MEPAARNHWEDISAAEAEGSVGREKRIGDHRRTIVVGENRVFRQHHAAPWETRVANRVVRIKTVCRSHQGAVRREWRGDHFISANGGAHDGAVKPAQDPGRISGFGTFPEGGLFEGAAHFATAGNFTKIVQTAPELAFRPGTAGESEHCDQGQERKGNSHKCFDVATNLMRFAKLVKGLLKKVHAKIMSKW